MWDSQTFVSGARDAGRSQASIDAALGHANAILAVSPDLPIVFTLNHLAQASGVAHKFLLDVASRSEDSYRDFIVRKRVEPMEAASTRRYRTICIPSPELMKVQRWIQKNILAVPKPHGASSAYSDGDTVFRAAMRHRAARWLIKIDIQSFFESIKEPYVYGVFEKLGYPDLLSFELARICTRLPTISSRRAVFERHKAIPDGVLKNRWMGFLPQGAPTSPQLANLVMRKFDRKVTKAATNAGLRYSRYSDDLIFSTTGAYTRTLAEQFVHSMYDHLGAHGFEANRTKTSIAGPGARKIVLGLLVDRDKPRLTRDFRARLETHIHYIERKDVGPVLHARFRGFDSVIGFQNHLLGLIAFAGQVDQTYAKVLMHRMRQVDWHI